MLRSPKNSVDSRYSSGSPQLQHGRSSRAWSASSRQTNSPQSSGRRSRHPQQTSTGAPSSSSSTTSSARNRSRDRPQQPAVHPPAPTYPDEGLDTRKFSMVTDDSTSPQDDSSRGDAADSSGDLRAVARPVIETYVMHPIRAPEEQRRPSPSNEQRSVRFDDMSQRYEDTSDDREPDSKRSSEEFYTPDKLSPTPTSDEVLGSTPIAVPSQPSPRPSQPRQPSPPQPKPRPPPVAVHDRNFNKVAPQSSAVERAPSEDMSSPTSSSWRS